MGPVPRPSGDDPQARPDPGGALYSTSMFRVRLASGKEAVFETVDELALGIQGGSIPATAEIFHSKTQKWLPISVHPVFEQAAVLIPGGVGSAAVVESDLMPLEVVNPAELTPGGTVPIYHMISKSGVELAERRRPKWIAPTAGMSAGVVIVTIFAWLFVAGGLGSTQGAPLAASRQLSIPVGTSPFATQGIRNWDRAPARLASRMEQSLDSVGQRLANDAGELGLGNLMNASSMATAEAIQASHHALLLFRPLLYRYRTAQRELSRAYSDTAGVLASTGAWTRTDLEEWRVRSAPVEPARDAARGDSLVAALERLYTLMQEQQGSVLVTSEWVRFSVPGAGDEYDALRTKIQRLTMTSVPGEHHRLSPTLLLLIAVAGDGTLPRRSPD